MNRSLPVFLQSPGMICSLGATTEEIGTHLFSPPVQTFTFTDAYSPGKVLPLGLVGGKLPDLANFPVTLQSRNNQLILAALMQMEDQLQALFDTTAKHRIGVVIGSSTSGIYEGEQAVFAWQKCGQLPQHYHYAQQEIGAPAQFVQHCLGITGPVQTISTACSSGAKALASARRLITLGICDAVICGGADSLCKLTVNGFLSLDSVCVNPCSPFKANRSGINIGEGACIFIMTKQSGAICLLGAGESSDAHHISAPDPNAQGAIKAMQQALLQAKLRPEDIHYINLHGTATMQNDQMESRAVYEVFGTNTPCSSTKALTGHTLGAAGALEAGFCWLTLNQAQDKISLPPQLGEGPPDPELAPISLVARGTERDAPLVNVLSNSFAFGGSNISLILGKLEC